MPITAFYGVESFMCSSFPQTRFQLKHAVTRSTLFVMARALKGVNGKMFCLVIHERPRSAGSQRALSIWAAAKKPGRSTEINISVTYFSLEPMRTLRFWKAGKESDGMQK